MANIFLFLGSINAFLAVALGAFGAHALKSRLSEKMLNAFETGVHYHLIHAIALIAIAILSKSMSTTSSLPTWSGWLLVSGIVLFSGSLYALSLSGITRLGIITPFGGIAFLAGWLVLAIYAIVSKPML
ncbi:MAG: DUF423 domain-containing protein [Paenibacillaceae bacterium]